MYARTRVILAIAGSDSGAGAGIQADIKTAAAFGVYAATAVTAVTAQSTAEVRSVHAVPPAVVADQIDVICADLRVAAVKIGLLPNPAVVEVVADALVRWRLTAVVLDPVMVASLGVHLSSGAVGEAIRRRLLPLAEVVTPNRAELEALAGQPAGDEAARRAAGRTLLAAGVRWVLCKGGHARGPEAVDVLLSAEGERTFATPRVATANGHGTGCTLSAAIAAGLATGASVPAAVGAAKDFLTEALRASERLHLGSGPGPVHHFHKWWR